MVNYLMIPHLICMPLTGRNLLLMPVMSIQCCTVSVFLCLFVIIWRFRSVSTDCRINCDIEVASSDTVW